MSEILPDCMMPDGADPCAGYHQLRREIEQLQAKLHCMCGSPIDHSAWEGHAAVSMYDYALDRAEAESARLRALLDFQGEPVDGPLDGIYSQYRDRIEQLERLRSAAQSLADFCKKSVNVGPISAAPATEAFLWLDLRAQLENCGESVGTPEQAAT